jgi:hypothetical protein
LLAERFHVEQFPCSLNISTSGSELRVQIQTDPRYFDFPSRASVRDVLGVPSRYSHPVDRTSGVRSDHTVVLTAPGSLKHYPAALRRVRYFDSEHQQFLVFLTNNLELPAFTIANLYRSRWQVEPFFKWIKQHLRIKVFLGTSRNAVKTQIWIAISIYVLVAIIRKELSLSASLYQILQVVSVTIFERTPILQALQLQHTGEKLDPFSTS